MTSAYPEIEILKLYSKVIYGKQFEDILQTFLYHVPLDEVPLVLMGKTITIVRNLPINPQIIIVQRGWNAQALKFTH